MKTIASFFMFLFFLLLSHHLLARPFTNEDQGYKINRHETHVTLLPDGKAKTQYRFEYEILSEKGRQEFNIYRISYNSNTEKVKVKTISVTNGVETKIDVAAIEEKSLFGGHSGYDETKTLVVPLPRVKVGSIVKIEYEDELFHPPYPGVISKRYHLSYKTPIENFAFEVVYPKTATFHLHDLRGVYKKHMKSTEVGENKKESIHIQNLPGIGFVLEPKAMFPEKVLAWVDVTSLKTFEEAGKVASVGFDKVLSKPLPEKLAKLFSLSPKVKEEKIFIRLEQTLKNISNNFRYFGDWRSVDGGFVPRELSEISKTGYGDCKDFSTLVVRAAREMGLKANVAFVFRSFEPFQKKTVPNLGIYNHAIALVQNPENKNETWWVDATNPRPHLGIIPGDISNRHALVLGKNPGLKEIPLDSWEKSKQEARVVMSSQKLPHLDFTTKITLTGHMAWEVQNDMRGKSNQQIEEYLTNYLAISNYDKENFVLKEKSFQDVYPFSVLFDYKLTERFGIHRAGELKIFPVYTFGDAHRRIMDVVPEDRHSDLYMGALKQVQVEQYFQAEGLQKLAGTPQSCQIESSWLDYSRKVQKEKAPKILDSYRVKKSRITLDEIKSETFHRLQNQLRGCLKGVKLVME